MARHGTTPEMFYQGKLHISEDRVDLALFEDSDSSVVNENEEEVETAESDPENGEEVPEYDSSTNKDGFRLGSIFKQTSQSLSQTDR